MIGAFKKAMAKATPALRTAAQQIVTEEGQRGLGGDLYAKEMKKANTVEVTDTVVSVTLRDPLLVAIEGGMDSFDMKTRLLSSKNAKQAKGGGVYVDVPFTHDANNVPQAVKQHLKKNLRVETVRPPSPKKFKRVLRVDGQHHITNVSHTHGVMDGIMKSKKSFKTVRRVSTRSAATSWWHKGFLGRHVLKKTATQLKTASVAIIKAAFTAQGFKVK